MGDDRSDRAGRGKTAQGTKSFYLSKRVHLSSPPSGGRKEGQATEGTAHLDGTTFYRFGPAKKKTRSGCISDTKTTALPSSSTVSSSFFYVPFDAECILFPVKKKTTFPCIQLRPTVTRSSQGMDTRAATSSYPAAGYEYSQTLLQSRQSPAATLQAVPKLLKGGSGGSPSA